MLLGKYINKYYLRYGWLLLIGIVALITVDSIQTLLPEYLGTLVEMIQNSQATIENITPIIESILLIAAGIFLGRVTWRLSIFKASKNIEADLRHQMFTKAERLSQSYYHNNKVGSIMAWFTNDLENIEEFMGWGSVMIVDAFFMTVLVSYKMVKMDWALSIICFIPVLLIVVWGAVSEKTMNEKWLLRQESFDKLYDYAQENFSGIRVIKAFVKERQEIKAFAKVAKENQDTNLSFAKINIVLDVAIEIIIGVLFCGIILGFGSYCVYCYSVNTPISIFGHQIALSAGNLVTYIGYYDSLIWPLIAMGQIISMKSRSTTSLKRISAFLDEDEDIKDGENAIELKEVKGKIEFRNFTFNYPDNQKKHYLQDITLTIKPGELIGVVGKVGSGKTTLVNSLLHLYNIERGKIFIDDIDLMDIKIKSLRDNISYAPQDNFLFSDKVINNIKFSNRDSSDEAARAAARFADIDGNIASFSDGYDTLIGERGTTLSGGQKQRLSIARAYIKNCPIMILDDSVSAVDTKTEEVILNNIYERRKNKTTILIASRVSTISNMDRIIVLNEGKLEAFDTPERLLKISPTYKKMVYLQKLEDEVKEERK